MGDLVAPRERGRYQGYIAATFAVATIVGPLIGGVLVDRASWRWVFLVNLPIGAARSPGWACACRRRGRRLRAGRSTSLGAALLAARHERADAHLHLGRRRATPGTRRDHRPDRGDARPVRGAARARAAAADPIVPFHLLRTARRWPSPAPLFLATAALFAVTVFVPLFLQTTTGASPTEAGLLLVPAMLGITVSTTLAGRSIARTGRYKRFPIAGLALMAAALVLLAIVAGDPSQRRPASASPCSASASAWSRRC